MADPNFYPALLNDDDNIFRQAMFLNFKNNYYYLKVYLGVLEAYPDLKAQFGRQTQSYQMTDLLPRGVYIDGAEFVSTLANDSFFTDPPNTTLPVNQTYNIDYQDGSVCKISMWEQGQVTTAPYTLISGLADTNIMQIDWPTNIPFVGNLKLTQAWVPNARVVIQVSPSQFPYSVLLSKLTVLPYFNYLINTFGMVGAYADTVEDTERLAMILTLLGLANPAIALA